MARLGADDIQLDELARTFETSAKTFSTGETSITSMLSGTAWHGPDADQFRTRWTSKLSVQLRTTAERVGELAPLLRKQADAQRTASSAAGVSVGHQPTMPDPQQERREIQEMKIRAAEARRQRTRIDHWANGEGRQQLRDAGKLSEAEQAEWWTSLSDDQRAAILRNLPGELYALDGLPKDVTKQARDAYVDSVLKDLTVSSTKDSIKGELDLAVIELSAEASAKISRQADGTYTVDLSLNAELAAKVAKSGKVGVGGGLTQTYEFDSQAEAEKFVQGLYDQFDVDLVRAPWNYGDIPDEIVEGVADHLEDHSDDRTKFVGEVKVFGGAEIDLGEGKKIELTGEVGGTYDFDSGDSTVFLGGKFSSELEAPLGPDGEVEKFNLNADVKTSLGFDDQGNATTLTVSGSVEASTTMGLKAWLDGVAPPEGQKGSFVQSTAQIGAKADFTATFDLDDKFVQEASAEFLERLQQGSLTNAELTQLLQEGKMTITVDTTASTSSEFDFVIGGVETKTTTTENALTWVKPAGGEFTFVTPGELREND